MSVSRYRFAGVTDNNQRYFAIGGNDLYNDLVLNEAYDPATDSGQPSRLCQLPA